MSIVVFINHTNGVVPKASLVSLTAAAELKTAWSKNKVTALCLGAGAEKAAAVVATYGVDEALFNEDSLLASYLAPTYAAALLQAVQSVGADTVVATASSTGKDLIPRFAATWDAGVASDIIAVNSNGTLKRPMYAGDAIADVEILTSNKAVTVRGSAFGVPSQSGSAPVSKLSLSVDGTSIGEVIGHEVAAAERPELTDASIVVSGGRALQSSENFEKYMFPLADSLGAAVGASRAAVDSGYAPNDWQVGQTGKIVAPELYIAVGISGAIQHLAGMKDSKTIVAINKDGDAPIFEIADYGLVADLYEAVPALTSEIKRIKG